MQQLVPDFYKDALYTTNTVVALLFRGVKHVFPVLMYVRTHACIQQDFPQQRLDVIVCSSYDDGKLVPAVHVINVEVLLRKKTISLCLKKKIIIIIL